MKDVLELNLKTKAIQKLWSQKLELKHNEMRTAHGMKPKQKTRKMNPALHHNIPNPGIPNIKFI